jgi:acyl-CoA dehydrogenase
MIFTLREICALMSPSDRTTKSRSNPLVIEEIFSTPERRELRATVRAFVEKEVTPHLDQWEQDGEVPRSLHLKAGELGLLGVGFDERIGGSGGDLIDKMVLWEELILAGGSSGLLIALFTHEIAIPHIIASGSAELIERWVRPTLVGELIGALGVTEPAAGSDVASLRTSAVREEDHFRVNGSKIFITSGLRADFVTTAVRTGGPGARGLSLLVIPTATDGFSVGRKLDKMGWRCSDTAELFFDDALVPVDNLVGDENTGFAQLMGHFQDERVWLATAAYSTAQRCLDLTVRSLKDRQAFGGWLIDRQALQHQLVDMAQRTELARTYVREVATRLQDSAVESQTIDASVSMAKNAASSTCTFVVDQAVRLHGGMGFMRESEVERHYRDAPVLAIGGGAEEVMTEVAAKRLGYHSGH